jgi:hypothetical protein
MLINKVTHIKVYPGIGTARVGNSPEYFIGPEFPGNVPNLGKKYKDANGLLKPQASRFRVYGYDVDDNVVMEITHDPENGISLEWDVHMRNLKAANYAFQGKFGFNPDQYRNPGVSPNVPGTDPNSRESLIIDPGMKSISGISQNETNAIQLEGGKIFSGIGTAEIPTSLLEKGKSGTTTVTYTEKEVSLGRLETDDAGRLIVVGGKGDAGCLIEPPIILQKGVGQLDGETTANENPTSNGNSYFNNPGWYDDTSGGSINASVTINIGGLTPIQKELKTNNTPTQRGWVAVSPPKYVPTMNNVVSLLDLQLDMFPEEDPVSGSLNFAVLDTNGLPNIATGNSTLSFASISGDSIAGKEAPSLASFQGKDYLAYTGKDGSNLLAVSGDGGTTWTESKIASNTTSFAPSICVFNGLLTYVIVTSEGYLEIGTSDNGSQFTFNDVIPSGGVQATKSASSPSAVAYNGSLFIAFTSSNGGLLIAEKIIDKDKKNAQPVNLFAFTTLVSATSITFEKSLVKTAPSLGVFFGALFYAYTGADNKSYIGSYKRYSPQPATPVIEFDFKHVGGAQTTTLSPAISGSHGKLYYALIGADSSVNVAVGKPGFTDLVFIKQGSIVTSYAPAIANFNSINFFRDIYPILKTVTDYAWVNEPAFQGHAPGSMGDFLRDGSIKGYSNPNAECNPYRSFVYQVIRPAEQLTPMVPAPPAKIPNPTNITVDGIKPSIPDGGVQSGRLMPHLFGEGGSNLENTFNKTNFPNQWLSLTPHQLWKIQEWVNGNFTTNGTGLELTALASFEEINIEDQPAALNFSALEPTVGGGFHPGIELTYNMKEPGYFAGPFRFNDVIKDSLGKPLVLENGKQAIITPGSVAGYMSIPWQGDFWSCNISWWAAMRPDIVVTMDQSLTPPKLEKELWFRGEAVGIPHNADNLPDYEGGYEHMVRYWSYFGFVVPDGTTDDGMFVMDETERATCLDDTTAPCVAVNMPEAIHLGVAQPESATTTTPYTFYSNSVDTILPSEGTITLSSSEDGSGDISVDDKCVIKINEMIIYSHDYSNGNSGVITPVAPINISDIVNSYRGFIATITIEYIDLHPNSRSGTDYWISFS